MTRFSLRFRRSKAAAIALAAATLAAPLAVSPALAAGWDHGRAESHPAAWQRDREDWRRPVMVAPAPVYRAQTGLMAAGRSASPSTRSSSRESRRVFSK